MRDEKRKVRNKLYITRGNGSITTNPHSPPPLQSTQDVHSSDFIILVPLLVLALVLLLVIIPKGHARSPTSTATTTCTGGTREAGGGGSCWCPWREGGRREGQDEEGVRDGAPQGDS